MSVTDPSVEPAQPEEGQGGEETSGGSPWESLLDRFPEDQRDVAAEVLREQEAEATKRFQAHADYRKQWEPFEQAGIQQYQPDQLSWALQVAQAAQNDPQALRTWLDQQHGPVAPQEPAQPPQQDDLAYLDPQQQLNQMLEQRLTPLQQQLEQFNAWRDQQEQAAAQAEGVRIIESQIEELKGKHGDFNRDIVEHMALKYADQDPQNAIPRAFAEYQAFVNQIEKQALQAKVDAPSPAETGGPADVSPEKITSFKQAEEIAAQFLRNGRA